MGRPGAEIFATSGNAVMFVEVAYDYQPIVPLSALENQEIVYTASFNVRDSRDLFGGVHSGGMPVALRSLCD